MTAESSSSDVADTTTPTSQGVYGIGVASDLVGTAIQNLRAYERAGLVTPARTPGGTRLYSPDDVARLRRIQALLAQGLNLAGIAQVLELEHDNQRLRDRIADLSEDGQPDAAQPRGEPGSSTTPGSGEATGP